MILAGLGKVLFPWKRRVRSGKKSLLEWMREPGSAWRQEPPNPRAAAAITAKA
jgi:hypothetical protein